MVSFECGTHVMYKMKGVCLVDSLREMKLDGKVRTYYLLRPLADPKEEILVPIDSEVLLSQMHKTLTQTELCEAFTACAELPDLDFIPEMRPRAEHFKGLLLLPDRVTVLRLVRTLHTHRSELLSKGKRLCVSDAAVLERAEHLLASEIAHAFGESNEAARERLLSMLK